VKGKGGDRGENLEEKGQKELRLENELLSNLACRKGGRRMRNVEAKVFVTGTGRAITAFIKIGLG